MKNAAGAEVISIGGRDVAVTHPEKLYFSKQVKLSKLDIANYYLGVASGALAGIRDRPTVLKRFVNGAEAEAFYQKRAPADRPEWLRSVTLSFPSGRTAEEIVVDDTAGLIWIVNLGCMELHPHAVRSGDLDHPDELRIDLDPGPGVGWAEVRPVALTVKAVLGDAGLEGWPKTSGSRGMHINVRIAQRWNFTEVRRAALALSREVERRVPKLASSKWWKEERHGVFLDYNQNAKDRTTASAYSVRPLPDARVSAPLSWAEVADCEPADFTVLTMPRRFAEVGDPHEKMDQSVGALDGLLELAARDEAEGLGDAPWPPHFRKMEGEAPRISPSRAKAAAKRAEAAKAGLDETAEKRLAKEPAVGKSAALPAISKTRSPRSKAPLVVIANSPSEEAAKEGLERWKARHPEAAALLAVDDVLVDRMRGRSTIWFRIRVNLRHVPEGMRPQPETPDPDDDPTRGWGKSGE